MTKSKKSKTSTSKNFKSRGWFLTINNPIDKGFTHEKIKEILETKCAKHEYWCMSDEIGKENGTPHTHLLILFYSPISFSSMQNKFKGAHLDAIKGQPSQVRNYILKGGKWENHDRADTKVEQQFETLQKTHKETWEAFKRRIHHFEQYKKISDTEVEIIKTEAEDFFKEELPFK